MEKNEMEKGLMNLKNMNVKYVMVENLKFNYLLIVNKNFQFNNKNESYFHVEDSDEDSNSSHFSLFKNSPSNSNSL